MGFKPIQMNFDPAGRLWIASSEVYPQIQPGQVADDKILIVEDRDGDGRADRTSVFAGGLLIPTGIEPGDGGAYVANSTELLHLKDTDGDGKADQTRVVLSGFGTEDTHHILHTLRWGYDGMLYFNQSVYIHSHIETPHGVRRLGGGGIWQFRPETMRLEVFIRGLVNPWGHHFDRWGQSFATDGAGGEGINYCIPGASYFWAVGAVRIFPGLNPGSPKYCGLEVVSGRQMPESWQGNLLTNDFRGNRVCRFVVSDDGAGFAAREQPELIKTKHMAFRPIDIKMGPDGAIYIADWYNPIIQHGEVDFRDPRRDHTRGRIWRVTAKGRPLVPRPALAGAATRTLLDALKSPEQWTRQQARRVLQERGASAVTPELAAWVGSLDRSEPGAEHHRLEALWTFEAIRHPEPKLLAELLHSPEASVRSAAVRVVPQWKDRLDDPVAMLGERVADEDPRVRLEAVRALAEFPSLRSAELALAALDRPVDRFLEYGLWLTARQLSPQWLPAVQAGRFDFGGHPARLVYALMAVGTPDVVKPLLALLREGKVPKDQDEKVQGLIATLGGPDELAAVLDVVLQGGVSARAPPRGAPRSPGAGGPAAEGCTGGGPLADRAAVDQPRRCHASRGAARGRGVERPVDPGPAGRAGGGRRHARGGPRRGDRGDGAPGQGRGAAGDRGPRRSRGLGGDPGDGDGGAGRHRPERRRAPHRRLAREAAGRSRRRSPGRAGRRPGPSRRAGHPGPGDGAGEPRSCRPTWPSSASARSAPRAATNPPWSPRCRRPASWTPRRRH